MEVTLAIAGTDYTSRLLVEHPAGGTWQLDLNEGSEIDQATFWLDDPDNDLSIITGQEVIITRTDVMPNVRLFGGIITQAQVSPSGLGSVWACQAQDWTLLLHRAVVDADYKEQTDKAIIADAFSAAGITEIDAATNVLASKTFDFLRFTGQSLYQVLDLLAESAGASWYINPDKELVYRYPGAEFASFHLTSSPDDVSGFAYWSFRVLEDATGVYNRVIVRGGKELSDDQEIILSNDGANLILVAEDSQGHLISTSPTDADTAFTPQGVARVEVFKNTGTDGSPVWTQQGVGLEGQDELGASFGAKTVDVLWNLATRRLQFNTAPPNLTNSVKVRGRYPIQIEVEDIDQASIDSLGRTFTKVIVDEGITTESMATDMAQAFLNEHSDAHQRITCTFDHDGLEVGQQITFTNSARGINAAYKVHALQVAFVGGTTAFYTAVLGHGSHTLEHILTELREATRKTPPQEEARTDVRRPAREVVELVDLSIGARTIGFPYYITGDDGPVFDLDAPMPLNREIPLDHPLHTENDSAGWMLALMIDPEYDGNRGPATTYYVGFSKVS